MAWAPDYVSADELAEYMRIGDGGDAIELAVAATSAARAVDDHCNRQFGLVAAPEQRFYTAWPDYERGRWIVDVDDFMITTGLAILIDGVALTDYDKEPINAAAEGKPWTRLAVKSASAVQPTGEDHEVAATVRWGWTTVPVPVRQASFLQGSRFHSRRDSPYGVAGSPQAGSELRLLSKLDADVAVGLRGLVRTRRPR